MASGDAEGRQRFTLPEWQMAKHMRLNQSENIRLEAERLLAESGRLRDETTKKMMSGMEDTNKRLEQRMEDVDFWRSEINMRLVNMSEEIDSLNTYFARFENTRTGCNQPLDVARQCLMMRDQRQGIDLVHDIVQENLHKEVEVIRGAQDLAFRSIEHIREMVRLNRKARYRLEHDLSDKSVALTLDNYSANLRPYSGELWSDTGTCLEPYQAPEAMRTSNAVQSEGGASPPARLPCDPKGDKRLKLTIHEWRTLTNEMVHRAECQLNESIQFRALLEAILSQVATDIRFQLKLTDEAFQKRIEETKGTKTKMEEEHAELERQISAVEENISGLQKSIASLEVPLTMAQTRLNVRDARPNAEFCHDPATEKLTKELEEANAAREALRTKIRESEKSLQMMTKTKYEILDDIKIKSQTLFIDEVQCLSLRKTVTIQQY